MKLTLDGDEIAVLDAVFRLAKVAMTGERSGESHVRQVVRQNFDTFIELSRRVRILEKRRELNMGDLRAENRYLHVSISKDVYDRLQRYLLHTGGGKVRPGAPGELVERAVEIYLDKHPIVLPQG